MPVNLVNRFIPFFYRLDEDTRFNMKIDMGASVCFGFFAGAVYPFFAVTAVRLGVTGTLLAMITAAPFMGQLFAVYWGHRSDQGQKLPFVVISGILSRLMVILLAFVSKAEFFALFVILHFLLASIGGPAFTSLVRKIYPLQFRGQIMGRIQFIIGMVRVVVTYLAGLWLDAHGFTSLFIVAGSFGILSSLIFTRIKEPQEKLPPRSRFSLRNTFQLLKADRLLRLAITGFFIFDLGNLILAPVYPLVQVNELGLTNLQIGQLAIFWIAGWFTTVPLWGWIIDHFQPLHSIVISIIIFLGSPLIYFFQSPYYLLMLASFLGGAAGSSLELGWLNLMMKLGGARSSQYSGLYLTMLGVRGLIGPLIGNSLLKVMVIYHIFMVTVGLLILGSIPFIIMYFVQKGAGTGQLKSK